MRKKTVFLASVNVCALAMSFFAVYSASQNGRRTKLSHADDEYELVLNATTLAGANGSGSAQVRSLNGGAVQFDYSGLSIEGGKLVLASGATIANPRLSSGNNNYISGIKHVAASVGADDAAAFTLDYTWGESLTAATPYYQRRGYVLSKAYPSYGFLGETPNFLKFTATADSVVESITIKYTCSRSAEAGDNLVISTPTYLEQFKTVVNRGNNFAGQTIELGDDIDVSTLEEGHKMSPIGNTDALAFKGVFDGKNHTISNFSYSGGDAVALFSRVTNGTIKNLKLSNIDITTTTQRSAGVVARAVGATIDNVHVLSGTISGKAQDGGIVGVVVTAGETTVVKNCTNAATIQGTSEANGGIVGYLHSGNVTIDGCSNTGSVSGASNGTGGIFGASAANASYTIIVQNCENNGTVNGASYVGGIAGLPRKCSASSKLLNCKNYGNVTASSTGAGGIVGLARIDVTNCGCYYLADIKKGTTSATNLIGGAAATPGFITSNTDSGNATSCVITGCVLINLDGTEHVS